MRDDEHGETGAVAVDEERETAALLTAAGPRPTPPPEAAATIEATAREEWRRLVARERERRRFASRRTAAWLGAVAAAAVLAALGLRLAWRTAPTPPALAPVALATVELVRGELRGASEGGAEPLTAGATVAAGTAVETAGASVAALRSTLGGSLRLDADSRAVWLGAERVRLERGALSVDSAGRVAGAGGLEVETPFGVVEEVGTQFEVRLGGAAEAPLRVRVREGEVTLRDDGRRTGVRAGEEVGLTPGGSLRRATISRFDATWGWAAAAAPAPEIEGRTLAEFLAWLERETGWTVALDGDGLAVAAESIRLHGSIAGMTPEEALSVVLPGSGLAYRLDAGTLTLARAAAR